MKNMKKLLLLLSVFLIFLLALSCEQKDTLSKKKSEAESESKKAFLIGLIPEQNIFKQKERYQPLADYLSKEVDITIRLTMLPRYGNIINNFVSTGLDGAFFGSFTYALAHKKIDVEVLARPLSHNGTSTYHGLIFVRKDSGIRSIEEMEGKRFAFVDKATTAGYLLPLAYFKKHDKDYKKFLKESYFTGTHADAILDVLNKKADIGAAKNTIYERLMVSDERIKNELVILERSPDVPENGLAVRKDLNDPLKKKLKESLITMHENPEGAEILRLFGAQQFIETTNDDYLPVYRYAEEIELDLATYDYMNE